MLSSRVALVFSVGFGLLAVFLWMLRAFTSLDIMWPLSANLCQGIFILLLYRDQRK
jgi:hypothetical protein